MTIMLIPGTIIELDVRDELGEPDEITGELPITGIDWLIYCPPGMRRKVGESDDDLPYGEWWSLGDGEAYLADEIDTTDAGSSRCRIAATAARLLVNADQFAGPQHATETIFHALASARPGAISALLTLPGADGRPADREQRIGMLAALGVTPFEIEQLDARPNALDNDGTGADLP